MKKYTENDILAAYPMCNFGGLVILEIESGFDDYIVSAFDFGDGFKNISKSKVYYTAKGEPYFKKYGIRYHLSNFMRTNI